MDIYIVKPQQFACLFIHVYSVFHIYGVNFHAIYIYTTVRV